MSLPKFNKDIKIISKLDDEPNDVGGLSANELKAKFDEAGTLIKAFINDTLLPYLESVSGAGDIGIANISGLNNAATVQEALQELKTQLNNMSTGSIPDRSLTGKKLIAGAVGTDELANASVTSGKIANGSVNDSKIASEKLSGASIRAKAIQNSHLNGKVIKAENVEDNSLTGNQIKDLSIPAAKIASGAVQTAKIANLAITAEKIAYGALVAIKNFSVENSEWTENSYGTYNKTVTIDGIDPAKHIGFLCLTRSLKIPDVDTGWAFSISMLDTDDERMSCIFGCKITAVNELTITAKEKPAGTIYLTLMVVHI